MAAAAAAAAEFLLTISGSRCHRCRCRHLAIAFDRRHVGGRTGGVDDSTSQERKGGGKCRKGGMETHGRKRERELLPNKFLLLLACVCVAVVY